MADYINKSILVQAYVKLDKSMDDLSPDEIIRIQVTLQKFAAERSQFFLDADVDTEVLLGEGSIKTWLTVLGSVYVLISQYPDFRNGVKLLHSDAKRLSEHLISETMFELRGRTDSTLRVEARVGIIGNINNIVNKISAVESATGEMDARRVAKILEQTSWEIDHLFSNISDANDKMYLRRNFYALAQRIPSRPRKPRRGDHHPDDIAIYEDRLKKLLEKLRLRQS